MTVKILQAREVGGIFHFRVHLDTTRMDGSNPHPEWVIVAELPADPPSGTTRAKHRQAIRQELRAQIKAELVARTPRDMSVFAAGTALPEEGEVIDPSTL